MTATSFERPRPYACDATSNCRCEEFAATSPEAARLIEDTWDVYQTHGAQGNELHFRMLPYAGTPDGSRGRVEVFLMKRECGAVWPRFAESHVFHLADNMVPHLRRAALLAQYEVRPPATQQELLAALASGSNEMD